MTTKELDIEIAAKIMGWKRYTATELSALTQETCAHLRESGWISPDCAWLDFGRQFTPSTDLNHCFLAQEKCIEKVGAPVYVKTMIMTLTGTPFTPTTIGDAYAHLDLDLRLDEVAGEWADTLLTATAEQRCLTMLKAMEPTK